MKLLRDFFRLCVAGLRTVTGRGAAASHGFSVTVPAPLSHPAGDGAVVVDLMRVVARPLASRREPASFLKAPRHRRLGAGRG
ncbi:hypothetical protein EAH75_17830 [Rhodanobacter glycinis]|uniref:Uncharacterized protein n=1 Tax=Rhodanobacter glycinis TaxID=582702 RepID=A0A502BZ33_9GAMM|nr:hypothetical protein [Rhodanobacter glycinis]TPG06495.1 hypothetical protein EAH88_14325 [Rhodanobacter glycinis]TPG45926.1 hypothetical protein EAH75_17830 [Rhodanobacter glycinis]